MSCLRHLLSGGVIALLAACGGSDAGGATSTDGRRDATTTVADGDDPVLTSTSDTAERGADTNLDDHAEDGVSLPPVCADPVLRVTIDGLTDVADSEAFLIAGSAGTATPIVPNGDGRLDDVAPSEVRRMGADTNLLTYTQWVGNHPFDADDLGLWSGPTPPPGSLSIALSVTPPTLTPIASGDVISSDDPIVYDAITTFATVSAFVLPAEGVDTFVLFNTADPDQGGTATVEYVDDEILCVAWSVAGETRSPDGRFAIDGTVVTRLGRSDTPFM